jgi:hypothetical protein
LGCACILVYRQAPESVLHTASGCLTGAYGALAHGVHLLMLVQLLDAPWPVARTSTNAQHVGTFLYQPPEVKQARTGASYPTAGWETWATGHIAHILLFGANPAWGKDKNVLSYPRVSTWEECCHLRWLCLRLCRLVDSIAAK